MSTSPEAGPAISQSPVQTGKRCPKCGAEMVLRVARKRQNEGQKFWGCGSYPRCRGILPEAG